jgi:tellurite methyltransferase
MTDTDPVDPPSPFVDAWALRLWPSIPEPRRALDLAMGRGRHALVLASLGFRVFGVDIKADAVTDACLRASRRGLTIRGWCADLGVSPLPPARFELIVVARFLQRSLCPGLVAALAPGGVLVYETFTEAQRTRGRGPKSPAHLLRSGELRSLFADLDVLFYEEPTDRDEDALARLVARKRSNPS